MKRYVFWRKPNGQPARETDGKHAPHAILSHIGNASSVNQDGSISYGVSFFDGWETALTSAFVVLGPDKQELNNHDAQSIFRKGLISAIKKSGGKQPLKETELLVEADQYASAYFRNPKADYLMVSSLSIAALPFKSTRIGNHVVYPLASRKHFPVPSILSHYPSIDKHTQSTKYSFVKISTSGHSLHEAIDSATAALHLLRGLWTLFSTFRSWSIRFGGAPQAKPIGIVHTGPIHTLHHKTGALAGTEPIFWYEPNYVEDCQLFNPEVQKWGIIDSNRRWALARIQASPFKIELERLIIRYAAALDQTDYDLAFLQLWGVLEKVTGTVGTNYEETITRAAWPFDNRSLSKELLGCMRLRRNLYVHSSIKREDSDQAIYLVKGFIDVHLLRLIRNSFNASSIDEYAQHLTLPTNLETLQRNKQLLNDIILFLKRKPKAQ